MNEHKLDALLRFQSSLSLLEMLRSGIQRDLLVSTAELLEISPHELCSYLSISWQALRRQRNDQPLPTRVADHLLQIVVVVRRATAVMGSLRAAEHWLKSPVLALGASTPISLLDSFTGINVVLDTLGRIEHGVHS